VVTRRTVGERAAEAGLGRVVRVHREHTDNARSVGPLVCGALAALLTAFVLVLNDAPIWPVPLFALAVAGAAEYLWVHLGPVADPGGRRCYVVAERGLLVRSPGAERVVRWDQVRGSALRPPPTCCGRDLAAALDRGAPVPRWTWRRLVRGAAVGGLAVAVLWTGVPVAAGALFGLPVTYGALSGLCEGHDGNRRSAEYTGPGPHLTVVYTESDRFLSYPDYSYPSEPPLVPREHPDLDGVQLVACAHLLGHADPDPAQTCPYTGGDGWRTYRGRYRLDVLSAHSGQRVASFPVTGAFPGSGWNGLDDSGCPLTISVPRDRPARVDDWNTPPGDATYRALLAPLVDGTAGGH
jgi:hypothetical protein